MTFGTASWCLIRTPYPNDSSSHNVYYRTLSRYAWRSLESRMGPSLAVVRGVAGFTETQSGHPVVYSRRSGTAAAICSRRPGRQTDRFRAVVPSFEGQRGDSGRVYLTTVGCCFRIPGLVLVREPGIFVALRYGSRVRRRHRNQSGPGCVRQDGFGPVLDPVSPDLLVSSRFYHPHDRPTRPAHLFVKYQFNTYMVTIS